VGAACVSFETKTPAPKGQHGPEAVPAAAGAHPLDPRPLAIEAAAPPFAPARCDAGEIPFGPGCATVLDDRVVGRSAGIPLLWTVAAPGVDAVFATAADDPFAIGGLTPNHHVALALATFDVAAKSMRVTIGVDTQAPMAHVVLNEVLANPLGPEPVQEWVELVNDGRVAANLDGYVLEDLGGVTPLPPATLAPGEFALVVNDGFVEDDGFDPKPAPGTQILRVPKLGKSGLTNAGEPLVLRDASGAAVSRVPPMPDSKAGLSLSRSSPGAGDAASSFALAPATPGAPNQR
jgi:hypothetical protein